MMDLVTLILMLTFAQNVTRLSTARARRLEFPPSRTWTISCHGTHPRLHLTRRRERRRGR